MEEKAKMVLQYGKDRAAEQEIMAAVTTYKWEDSVRKKPGEKWAKNKGKAQI